MAPEPQRGAAADAGHAQESGDQRELQVSNFRGKRYVFLSFSIAFSSFSVHFLSYFQHVFIEAMSLNLFGQVGTGLATRTPRLEHGDDSW